MRRSLPMLWALLAVVLLSSMAPGRNHAATTYRVALPFISTAGSAPDLYWGAAVKGPPYDMSKLEAFERAAGKKVAIFHWTHSWRENGAYRGFLRGEFEKIRAHGALPMMTWTTDEMGRGLNQPDFQLRDIYEGRHDAYIRQWATDAKAWGHPLFLRLNHEMNGWWYMWSEQNNGNQPGDFVRSWRHIHNIFEQVGATNVTWVWCVNATGFGRLTPTASLYPGDEYVDWVAMDGYNFGSDNVDGWVSAEQVFGRMYDEITAIAPGKPVMIAEIASGENGGPQGRPASKATWITETFARLPERFPRVGAVLWFNLTDGSYEWPIESSPQSTAAFARAIAPARFATSSYGSFSTSPIPSPRR